MDILRAGAGNLSTSAADVVDSLYLNVDPGAFDVNGNLIPNAYTNYSFNLFGILQPGQSYRLRFAEVDDISLVASTPEPGSLALLAGMGVTGALLAIRRSKFATHRL